MIVKKSKDHSARKGHRLPLFLQGLRRSRMMFYFLSFVFLLLLSGVVLAMTGCFRGGSCGRSSHQLAGGELFLPNTVNMVAQGQYAEVWIEFGVTDVFTPATTAQGLSLATPYGEIPPILDELAEKGYIAIRVPHAPPTYTTSSLVPGILPWAPDAVTFSYYAPPDAVELTTVAVSVTRRTEYESAVNARYPITDGQSHWEAWWLPEGETFPLPDEPFRLDTNPLTPSLGLRFRIDFVDADPFACAGRPFEVLAYNGYMSIGPFEQFMRFTYPDIPREPLVTFGAHCGYESEALVPSFGTIMSPTVPFTHVHCLENWDSVERTFTITASSSQGWDYTYYYQTTAPGAVPVPVPGIPFSVTVDAPPDPWSPGGIGLLAVYTPATLPDTMRETFRITATSVVSPEVQASSVSFALAESYELNELGQYRVYLPLVLKSD